jgi:ABC-2 type transport system permease protein
MVTRDEWAGLLRGIVHGLTVLLATAAMTVLLIAPFALVASAGRGYLAAVGAIFAAVFVAQVVVLLGYGQYFPWSVPALYRDRFDRAGTGSASG